MFSYIKWQVCFHPKSNCKSQQNVLGQLLLVHMCMHVYRSEKTNYSLQSIPPLKLLTGWTQVGATSGASHYSTFWYTLVWYSVTVSVSIALLKIHNRCLCVNLSGWVYAPWVTGCDKQVGVYTSENQKHRDLLKQHTGKQASIYVYISKYICI